MWRKEKISRNHPQTTEELTSKLTTMMEGFNKPKINQQQKQIGMHSPYPMWNFQMNPNQNTQLIPNNNPQMFTTNLDNNFQSQFSIKILDLTL